MSTCFTYPKDWDCLDELASKYPRSVGISKIIRIAIEEQNKRLEKKSNQSIEDFAEKYAFGLDSDVKIWKAQLKEMDATELRELQQLLKKREGLVGDEVYKRTKKW